jgi:hypothetical protein
MEGLWLSKNELVVALTHHSILVGCKHDNFIDNIKPGLLSICSVVYHCVSIRAGCVERPLLLHCLDEPQIDQHTKLPQLGS